MCYISLRENREIHRPFIEGFVTNFLAGKFKEINKGYYLLHEEINKTTFTKESMELLVSRAVELVQAVQEAIMSLPMDEQERGVGQSAPSAQ